MLAPTMLPAALSVPRKFLAWEENFHLQTPARETNHHEDHHRQDQRKKLSNSMTIQPTPLVSQREM
jgi:hypothetical protein